MFVTSGRLTSHQALRYSLCAEAYGDAVAVAFNATGRDFEIAIAIAITAFSPTVALTTVVGPLVEVPVMLFLVWAAMRLAPRLFGVRAGDIPAAILATP